MISLLAWASARYFIVYLVVRALPFYFRDLSFLVTGNLQGLLLIASSQVIGEPL